MAAPCKIGDDAVDFTYETPWESGKTYHDATRDKTTVLIFLRYLGCPVCQMEMADLKAAIKEFETRQASVIVFLQSEKATITALAEPEDWPFTIVCDPDGAIFRQYGVSPGGVLKYLHPAGLLAAIRATVRGFRHGKFEGRETQLPAVFVVDPDKRIKWVYYGKTLNDVPKPSRIADQI